MSTAAFLQNAAVKPQQSSHLGHGGRLLQRKCACGSPTSSLTGECEECNSKAGLQAKLTIGASNDPLEQEADRVADQVLAAPANAAISGAPPRIQRFTGQSTGEADTTPPSVERVLASPGRPLDPALRQNMEQRFGHDFSRVRVHTGGAAQQSARDLNANAYTLGHNIVFGAGRFAPGMHHGRQLIAHELAHVVQRSGSHRARVRQGSEQRSLSSISPAPAGFVQRQDGPSNKPQLPRLSQSTAEQVDALIKETSWTDESECRARTTRSTWREGDAVRKRKGTN